ncbi:MAG TPA: copper-binding protein [Gemmatimonadales bacterium]|nr:copper-binding protein [Gemmatimonadales bacterium]
MPAGPNPSPRRARLVLIGLFVGLLAAFAAGLWGTIIRPPAYEVRGVIVARPAPNLLLVRHEPVAELGMDAMELMAITADPALLDAASPRPGERVRLAVRRADDQLVLIRLERVP